ncbi:type IA DNA topoisomerase [Prolixibacteraceae bacterium JC049]|nr:type IA DNA topoisomerase [Prolixibacteraceae bacterium JC049]
MKVCIAEKPSVAKEIADILGARSRRDGYFEGNGYQITWTFGHLCTLKEPHDYTERWKYWNISTLPMIPPKFGIKVIDDSGVQKQFGIIEKLMESATEVINCGDAGQEGELIQRWVLQLAGCKVPIKRLWISSLTEEAIKEGFDKLQEGTNFDKLYAAGSARAIGDWLLGMNATRMYTLKYGQNKQVLSIGRVQTPTLALLVNRQKEIDNFKPEPYWEIKTNYRGGIFSYVDGRFSEQEKAEQAMLEIKQYDLEILSVETKKSKEHPLRLFDLTALQVECNRKFGMSADETLRTIQSLYEKKLTTYPRVDTTFLSNDIYKKVPGILKKLKSYEQLIQPILAGGAIRKSKKVFDDKKITDHHAIIPTGITRIDLSQEEKRVYETVTKRFISVFYPDCLASNTTIKAQADKHQFKATGKQIIDPGWRVVYQGEKVSTQADENILPHYEKGEKGPHEPELQEKQTQPPKYYTEATLLRAMETAGKNVDDEELRDLMKENGIGRPSTRANIIETLFRRRYIRKEKKRLVATPTGIELIDSIQNELLKSAELTGQWERKLRQIELGEYQIGPFMQELKQMVTEIITDVKRAQYHRITIYDQEEEKKQQEAEKQEKKKAAMADLPCPACGNGKLLKGKEAYGCSEWKNGCKLRLPFEFAGKKLTDNQVKSLSKKKETPLIKGLLLDDNKVDGKIILNEQNQLEVQVLEKEPLTCPACKQGEIVKGKTAWGCKNFKNGCRMRIPFEFMQKSITDGQLEQLIQKGKTRKIKGFITPSGEQMDGVLAFNDQYQLEIK